MTPPGVRSEESTWQNTNQLVNFTGAGLHFVIHHDFHSLEDLVCMAAAAFVLQFAARLEQLCQQRVPQMQSQE